jgi:uncharacterized protein YprB with RNaseH-like and TPR domain
MDNVRLREQLRRLGLRQGAGNARSQPRREGQAIEELVPGEIVDTDRGAFFLHRESYELGYRHGHHALTDLLTQPPEAAAHLARDERLADVAVHRIAFVDTETTGLAGGTGTYAFLVGVGLFEAQRFTIHQFFMRDYHEEPAQIQALGELLDDMEAVVSFNGKSFDLPLLETRFIMTRHAPRLVGAPHLDLLPAARRLWKYRLDSCALSTLEIEVLGVQRTQSDVPGWLIPSLYMEYARSGDAREMPRIFYHNAQDILSLVTLTALQSSLLTASLPLEVELPGEDVYGLGRLHQDLGQLERAELAYVEAVRTSRSVHIREMAMRDLAYLLKRQDRRQEALPWWQRLVETVGAVYACEELAKHHEWQDEDLAQAVAWTRQGLRLTKAWSPSPKKRDTLRDLQHRLERLEHKLEHLQRSKND